MKKINFKLLILSFVIVFVVAYIGNLFTSSNVNSDWYNLNKPSITPPSYVFPIVWTILFVLIAFSMYFAFNRSEKKFKNLKITLGILFLINFALNVLWSYLFFKMQEVSLAFQDLILLWFSILFLLVYTFKIDKKSFYLLIPYFLWVSFAGILNWLFTA